IQSGSDADPEIQKRIAAFRRAFGNLGWVEGRNIRIDYRYTFSDPGLVRKFAAEIIGLNPDVIVAQGTQNLTAFANLTSSIPIVFVGVSDPVSAGFVPSLAKPGGNITGFSNFEYSIGGKWLEILKEAAPGITRVGVLMNRDDPSWSRYLAPIDAAAPKH